MFNHSLSKKILGINEDQVINLSKRIKFENKSKELSFFVLLILTLMWLKHSLTHAFLAWLAGVSKSTITRNLNSMLDALYLDLLDEVKITPFNERFLNGKYLWRYFVTIIVDGTEQPINESKKSMIKNITYSQKKKQHSFTKLIAVTPQGKIVFLSNSYFGSICDKNLCEFPENHLNKKITNGEWIIGDSGFAGLTHLKILSYSTFKNTEYSKTYLKIRSVVENSIAMIKDFKICKYQFRKQFNDIEETKLYHHKVWMVVAALCNLYHDNLRS
jgi:hypothetical protein